MNGFDGKEHELQAILTFGILSLVAIGLVVLFPRFPHIIELAGGIMFGAFCGFWITPDLDHEWTTMEEYRAMRVNKGFGKLWIALWKPYAKFFGHRSKWTHSLVGTMIRAIPFMTVTGIFLDLLLNEFGLDPFIIVFHVGTIVGWLVQDMVHYHHDGLGWLGVQE